MVLKNTCFPELASILLGTCILVFSCNSDKNTSRALKGKWQVVEATRNGRLTSTLEDAYFEFLNDSSMRSNILRIDSDFIYELEGKKIRQKGEPEIEYQILRLESDTLILKTQISEFNFEFKTVKDSSRND